MSPERYGRDVSRVFEVDLRLLRESDGGRGKSIRSGYRSIMRFGTAEAEPPWGVQLDFEADELRPGEEGNVRVSTWAEDDPPISAGTSVWLYEGARLVGTGKIR